jgi:hypothetical protein
MLRLEQIKIGDRVKYTPRRGIQQKGTVKGLSNCIPDFTSVDVVFDGSNIELPINIKYLNFCK